MATSVFQSTTAVENCDGCSKHANRSLTRELSRKHWSAEALKHFTCLGAEAAADRRWGKADLEISDCARETHSVMPWKSETALAFPSAYSYASYASSRSFPVIFKWILVLGGEAGGRVLSWESSAKPSVSAAYARPSAPGAPCPGGKPRHLCPRAPRPVAAPETPRMRPRCTPSPCPPCSRHKPLMEAQPQPWRRASESPLLWLRRAKALWRWGKRGERRM